MKTIQTLDELLFEKVKEATKSVLKEMVRKFELQQQEISELKEQNRMIQTLLKSSGLILPPSEKVRMSAYDIRRFRKKLGITQEVLAEMLKVNKLTILRWENHQSEPPPRHKKMLIALKSMSKEELSQKIQAATNSLYN